MGRFHLPEVKEAPLESRGPVPGHVQEMAEGPPLCVEQRELLYHEGAEGHHLKTLQRATELM